MKIFLPREILALCDTPNKLIEYVGYTSSVIRLSPCDRNEMKIKTNPRLKQRTTPLHYHLHNFLMSRIPSDMYKIRNPSLGIEKDPRSNLLEVTEKKSKRLTEACRFGFVNHQHSSSTDRTPKNPMANINNNLLKADELERIAAIKDDQNF